MTKAHKERSCRKPNNKQFREKTSPGSTHPATDEEAGVSKPKQNKQTKQPNHQGSAIQNAHYGIKNMTHYRVLKQHTHEFRPKTFAAFFPSLKAAGLS
ncbi:hypothetical protein [Actinomyces radicidentis]|uniref:hypothetical protein n=1 Tax=Actinomyces radicidentis TaxID=111015 RepID=UPI0012377094|nr:hypothetical protein [Actinomyces radicidentis]